MILPIETTSAPDKLRHMQVVGSASTKGYASAGHFQYGNGAGLTGGDVASRGLLYRPICPSAKIACRRRSSEKGGDSEKA